MSLLNKKMRITKDKTKIIVDVFVEETSFKNYISCGDAYCLGLISPIEALRETREYVEISDRQLAMYSTFVDFRQIEEEIVVVKEKQKNLKKL